MKVQHTRIIALILFLALLSPLLPGKASADQLIVTDPTGYTSASDVQYKTVQGYIANWGARGEDCTFLSTYAQSYYTSDYSFDILSANAGGTSQTDAPSSALYAALKSMMTNKHTHITSYRETRDQYRYTDCLKNDTDHISSFYSGRELNGQWDSAKTWNREHTWPNSKGLGGSDEDDIMMLRPTWVSENSSRGNTAYGESAAYFDPGVSVRGDCARILLYTYVRWGNTRHMWGTSGVIENLSILLKWMEEDPVDTWEMGRNDAVQSITGVRNVFVDYPEFAWLLFGQAVPEGMSTPSQIGSNAGGNVIAPSCNHTNTEVLGYQSSSCTQEGYSGDTYCIDCQQQISTGNVIPKAEHPDSNGDAVCDSCKAVLCVHEETEIQGQKTASCTQNGYSGDTYCRNCGNLLQSGSVTEKQPHNFGDWVIVLEPTETQEGRKEQTCSGCGEKRSEPIPAEPSASEPETTDPSDDPTDVPEDPTEDTVPQPSDEPSFIPTDPSDDPTDVPEDPTEDTVPQPSDEPSFIPTDPSDDTVPPPSDEPTDATSGSSEPSTTPETTPDSNTPAPLPQNNGHIVIIVLVICVGLVIVVAAIVIVRKKKKSA